MSLLRSERFSAILLVAAAAVGLLLANTAAAPAAKAVESFHFGIPALGLDLSVGHWIKDGLLAIFFFIAAIELRHKLRHGELDAPRKAIVPTVAAIGGVVVPALIFLVIVRDPELSQGWPIPTATDIAFALGVLAIVGKGLPPTFRALLLALAVIDDLIAILIIAAFFTKDLAPIPLLIALPVVLLFGWLSYRVTKRRRAMVFATIFKEDVKVFAVFLFAGMIPWNCFNSIVVQSSGSFINNEGLIKKIYLPKAVFPLSVSVGVIIDSLLSFVALFAIIIAVGGTFSTALIFIPVAYVLLFMFSLGVGLVLSNVTVFFRDMQYVLQIAMQGLFFLTPILYKASALSGAVAGLVALNPVVPYIELFRAPLTQGRVPDESVIVQAFESFPSWPFSLGSARFFPRKEKSFLQSLELPYRILALCGGDMSFTSALTYDFEVYSAAQEKWLEVSSVSNIEPYQTNRMKIRFKDENGKMQLLHSLNGSSLALPRIVASLLENNQTAEGIKLPPVLHSYFGTGILS